MLCRFWVENWEVGFDLLVFKDIMKFGFLIEGKKVSVVERVEMSGLFFRGLEFWKVFILEICLGEKNLGMLERFGKIYVMIYVFRCSRCGLSVVYSLV